MFTITLDQPAQADDLLRFLRRMGFDAVEADYGTIEARLPGAEPAGARTQLQLYVGVWHATHDACRVTISP